MLVEMNNNEVYSTWPITGINAADMQHCLMGLKCKRATGAAGRAGDYVTVKNAKPVLVSRAHILRKLAD